MTQDLRAGREFHAYLRVREAVQQMQQACEGRAADASRYWTEELENIDYLADASPLIVRKLRHHAFHITGIRPYDYRSKDDGRREHFEARLKALQELGGDGLLVPESPALGGFGYAIDGRLFNVDTLKFYEVLIGMERGAVLPALRRNERPVVCEIGSGWAGFAYQFKTQFPRATYVLVDFPELFLFSATYLHVVFPEARLLFAGTSADATLEGWRDADFVFVPHHLADLVSTIQLDLVVNMVSFQEMTDSQVRAYAAMAARAGCPQLYSLNRERSPYNTELVSVSDAMSDYYRLTEVPVLDTDYTSAMKKPPKATRMVERSALGYRHQVGLLRTGAARTASSAGDPVAAGITTGRSAGPRVVLGMTLYNNARHLPEAIDSLLAQTSRDFVLVLLDDASTDETEAVARRYAAMDARVRYLRHATRTAMITTWYDVAELAATEYPSAEFFAWVSDHDRWHPRWLERLIVEFEVDDQAVLAYPITRRMAQSGEELEKGPRLFDTSAADDLQARWRHFCIEGVGSGDMVYGLMRIDALRKAGIFRRVLRPDRLLMAEMTLYGRIRQVPEVLWFRRQSNGTSVERQLSTLVLPDQQPKWFGWPPWFQHSLVLWREYAKPQPPPLPISRWQWAAMLLRYQTSYGWRHLRKTETSHALGRGVKSAIWSKKIVRHYFHHAVYNLLVGSRRLWGRTRRLSRRVLYEVLMLRHRLGFSGRGESQP
jgi:glycosyltransferase involved in cell wall biosynthesis